MMHGQRLRWRSAASSAMACGRRAAHRAAPHRRRAPRRRSARSASCSSIEHRSMPRPKPMPGAGLPPSIVDQARRSARRRRPCPARRGGRSPTRTRCGCSSPGRAPGAGSIR
jgi:hypothetical protein